MKKNAYIYELRVIAPPNSAETNQALYGGEGTISLRFVQPSIFFCLNQKSIGQYNWVQTRRALRKVRQTIAHSPPINIPLAAEIATIFHSQQIAFRTVSGFVHKKKRKK